MQLDRFFSVIFFPLYTFFTRLFHYAIDLLLLYVIAYYLLDRFLDSMRSTLDVGPALEDTILYLTEMKGNGTEAVMVYVGSITESVKESVEMVHERGGEVVFRLGTLVDDLVKAILRFFGLFGIVFG